MAGAEWPHRTDDVGVIGLHGLACLQRLVDAPYDGTDRLQPSPIDVHTSNALGSIAFNHVRSWIYNSKTVATLA